MYQGVIIYLHDLPIHVYVVQNVEQYIHVVIAEKENTRKKGERERERGRRGRGRGRGREREREREGEGECVYK